MATRPPRIITSNPLGRTGPVQWEGAGARCWTRTSTAVRPRDFKSPASANSAKRALGHNTPPRISGANPTVRSSSE
jgi:hypothetical protein